jgi:sepiapterin reductase
MSLIFITGASRGYGQRLALSFNRQFPQSTFVLFARSMDGLNKTKELLHSEQPKPKSVLCYELDLGKLKTIEQTFQSSVSEVSSLSQTFDRSILLNNSGSLGEINLIQDLSDIDVVNAAITSNVTGQLWLSKCFQNFVHSTSLIAKSSPSNQPSMIVNTSTLCALEPFQSMGLYCTMKAANEMVNRVIAAEEKTKYKSEMIKTLNWAPGAMQTDMISSLKTSPHAEPGMKRWANNPNSLIDIDFSATWCAKIVAANEFATGSHIDIHDLKK